MNLKSDACDCMDPVKWSDSEQVAGSSECAEGAAVSTERTDSEDDSPSISEWSP